MRTVSTWWANIYVGLRVASSKVVYDVGDARAICAEYCKCGLCVTVTPTTFVYTGGDEPGVIVGLINYPRFPKDEHELRVLAVGLADDLLRGLKQLRVSVQMPSLTVMLGCR